VTHGPLIISNQSLDRSADGAPLWARAIRGDCCEPVVDCRGQGRKAQV